MRTLSFIFITLVLAAGLFSGATPLHAQSSPEECEASGGIWNSGEERCVSGEEAAAQAAAEQKKLADTKKGCSIIFDSPWDCAFALLGNALLTLGAKFLQLTGLLLDNAVKFSLNIASFVKDNAGITEAWKAIRDFGNIAFIFVLLWIAIQTILGLGDSKKLLASVITAALLINFSLFFVKAIIDVSNVVAYQFYSAITKGVDTSGIFGNGISARFMQALELQSLYDISGAGEGSSVSGGLAGVGTLKLWDIALVSLFGFAFFIITGFIFLQAAIFFIARTVALMVIMVFSPLYFIGMLVPKINEHVKGGMNKLIEQSLVAPVYLMFLFVILKIMEKAGQSGVVGSKAAGSSFATALVSSASSMGGSIGIVVNFIVIIGLMLTALKVTKTLSGGAGAMGMKFFSNTAGLALGLASGGTALLGRQVLGRSAALLARNEGFKTLASKDSNMGRMANYALKRVDTVSKSSFDARNVSPSKLPIIGAGVRGVSGIVKSAGVGIDLDAGKPGVAAGKGFATQREQNIKAQVKAREDAAKLLEFGTPGIGETSEQEALRKAREGAAFKTAKQINLERRAAYAQSLRLGGGASPFFTKITPGRTFSYGDMRGADSKAADNIEKVKKGADKEASLEAAIKEKEAKLKEILGEVEENGVIRPRTEDEAHEHYTKKIVRAEEEVRRAASLPAKEKAGAALEKAQRDKAKIEKLNEAKERAQDKLDEYRRQAAEAAAKDGGKKDERKDEEGKGDKK